jgi:hypothetical protein
LTSIPLFQSGFRESSQLFHELIDMTDMIDEKFSDPRGDWRRSAQVILMFARFEQKRVSVARTWI